MKYVDKLYKILKKLNVKVVSYEVLKKDLAAQGSLLSKLHMLSGTLNNVNHHITQFLQESDNEVTHYKNIIRHKLRPQLDELVARNRALAQGEANQVRIFREENTELRVKVRELQKKLEQRVSHSKERMYKLQIQKLQGEVEKNKTEIGKLDLELKRHTS